MDLHSFCVSPSQDLLPIQSTQAIKTLERSAVSQEMLDLCGDDLDDYSTLKLSSSLKCVHP